MYVEAPSDRSTWLSFPRLQNWHLILSYYDDPTHTGALRRAYPHSRPHQAGRGRRNRSTGSLYSTAAARSLVGAPRAHPAHTALTAPQIRLFVVVAPVLHSGVDMGLLEQVDSTPIR